MKKRKVEKSKICEWCHNESFIQIYDFKNNIWVWYCEICQETIDDPNGIQKEQKMKIIYADGDYYHGGSKINHNAFLRAQSKLIKAIRDSHHKEDNNEQQARIHCLP